MDVPPASLETEVTVPSDVVSDPAKLLASRIPNRMALAGGWIDQPFVSRHNPQPPGSMVVISLEPEFWFMDRCGMAGSTRRVATRIWDGELPGRPFGALVRELYQAETPINWSHRDPRI
jgi:hypothetical protein